MNESERVLGGLGFAVEGAGADETDKAPAPPERTKKRPTLTAEQQKELNAYRKEAAEFVDAYRPLLDTFAGDTSLQFKMGEAFYINLDSGEVNLDARWFKEKGFTKEQILWACMHELSHFRDLADDPEGMHNVFKGLRDKARKFAPVLDKKWAEAAAKSNRPEVLDRLRKPSIPATRAKDEPPFTPIEASAYKMYHTFNNILDDTHVNGRVARRASAYAAGGSNEQQVVDLYKDKLFPRADYQELPRHLQFSYALLRMIMVPEEKVVVSPEVQEELDTSFKVKGENYPLLGKGGFMETFLRPSAKRDTSAGTRAQLIEKTLLPVFEKLLLKDIEEKEFTIPPEQEGDQGDQGQGDKGEEGDQDESSGEGKDQKDPLEGEGEEGKGKGNGLPKDDAEKGKKAAESGNPFEGEYEDFEQNSTPDQISEDETHQWQEYYEGVEEEGGEDDKEEMPVESMATKQAKAQQESDREWAQQNSVPLEVLQQFREIERNVAPYVKEFSELWEEIISGKRREIEIGRTGYYKTGELSVDEAIRRWGEIQHNPERAEVMERPDIIERLVNKPELIRVRLSGDLSGSMDPEKITILQQCYVLILSSLREFETKLNLSRGVTKSSLHVDTEGWVFATYAKRIKQFAATGGGKADIEIVRIFEQLKKGTVGRSINDNEVFREIKPDIIKHQADLQSGKVMDIILEVTDGGSSAATEARRDVDELEAAGAVVRAFQIGVVDSREKQLFDMVWNDNRKTPRGEVVGSNIKDLLPAMVRALKQQLRGVRL